MNDFDYFVDEVGAKSASRASPSSSDKLTPISRTHSNKIELYIRFRTRSKTNQKRRIVYSQFLKKTKPPRKKNKMLYVAYSPFVSAHRPHRPYGKFQRTMRRRPAFVHRAAMAFAASLETKPMRYVDHADRVDVAIDVPGIKRKDLKMTFENGELEISGVRRLLQTQHDDDQPYSTTRKFVKRLSLDDSLEGDAMTAQLSDGVLHVSIPKKIKTAPVEIPIVDASESDDEQRAIEIDDSDKDDEGERDEPEGVKPAAIATTENEDTKQKADEK